MSVHGGKGQCRRFSARRLHEHEREDEGSGSIRVRFYRLGHPKNPATCPNSTAKDLQVFALDSKKVRLCSLLSGNDLQTHCRLGPSQQDLLETAMERLGLSARAYHRILRVARTIADLAELEQISTAHLGEAIGYRSLYRTSV